MCSAVIDADQSQHVNFSRILDLIILSVFKDDKRLSEALMSSHASYVYSSNAWVQRSIQQRRDETCKSSTLVLVARHDQIHKSVIQKARWISYHNISLARSRISNSFPRCHGLFIHCSPTRSTLHAHGHSWKTLRNLWIKIISFFFTDESYSWFQTSWYF